MVTTVREPRELLTGLQNAGVARLYLMLLRGAERRGAAVAVHRGSLLAGLHGRVLELGAGKGLNFAYYPPTVREVVATEPDVLLREQALAQAARSPVRVSVLADAAAVATTSCDAAVVSLVLCTVPDPGAAMAQVRRTLRPGAELRFYEHVRSGRAWVAGLQQVFDPGWSRIAEGCHTNRNTLATIRSAGFSLGDVDRFSFRPGVIAPPMPHVLGRAHRV